MRKTLFTLFLVGALLLTRAEDDDKDEDTGDDDKHNFATVIGIDLETTYSCVGVMMSGICFGIIVI